MHAAADSGCNENGQLMCEHSNYGLGWHFWVLNGKQLSGYLGGFSLPCCCERSLGLE